MRRLLRAFPAWLLAICLAAPAAAQSTSATVSGTVSDIQGGVLAGAHIVLKNLDTGQSRDDVSDKTGNFRVVGLPPGRYELRATLKSFVYKLPTLTLAIGAEAELADPDAD